MNSLIDNVMGQLDQQHIDAIASQLGTDPDQARNAIEHALPLIVGGLSQNASTPQGAQDLHDALGAHAGTDLGSLLGGLLGGGGGAGSNMGAMGGAILSHIFGNNQSNAAQGLGQATGLGTQNSGQLMAILAPLVLSALSNMSQRHGLDPNGVGGVLSQDVQRTQQSGGGISDMLTSVLGSQNGGPGLGGLMAAAGSLLSAFTRR
ncbi:DUF937 domain-containing protein [Pseudolysobacter antarcticus]|uniref:DUF937 domain-containing protein n=1 Tax=Pseudolysobacter antarcticus TaxID=2511995 RepID=A0A411HN26_9GAMM|nr:DUF937 domain-containing protein [Pseudolysobacter antarcticus]QBB71876.1 DUF937 domain-containing protein [Pseudolysobacter antarcticus]